MSDTCMTLPEYIRNNRRLCNMLNWEANGAKPEPSGPRDALERILANPKRRAKIQKELDKNREGHCINLDDPNDPAYAELLRVICDFREDWEVPVDA